VFPLASNVCMAEISTFTPPIIHVIHLQNTKNKMAYIDGLLCF
jgi:hypothetical protein